MSCCRADGSILRPYDMANFVLAEHMGVHVFPANQEIDVELEQLTDPPELPGRIIGSGKAGWLLSRRFNDAFLVVNIVVFNNDDCTRPWFTKQGIDTVVVLRRIW